jgi:mRNA-degrading endonuclease RelE of RelBE toxin-antitoxin system
MRRSRSCPTQSSTRKSSATGALSIEAKDACTRSMTSSERRSQPVPRESRVKLSPEVADVVRSLPPEAKRKVRAALQQLRLEPELGDQLERELTALRRVRVGQLRIVYRPSAAGLEIVAIGPRRSIYTELELRAREGS